MMKEPLIFLASYSSFLSFIKVYNIVSDYVVIFNFLIIICIQMISLILLRNMKVA